MYQDINSMKATSQEDTLDANDNFLLLESTNGAIPLGSLESKLQNIKKEEYVMNEFSETPDK
jgi:hypothetical protein